jgi:hypothetical protein
LPTKFQIQAVSRSKDVADRLKERASKEKEEEEEEEEQDEDEGEEEEADAVDAADGEQWEEAEEEPTPPKPIKRSIPPKQLGASIQKTVPTFLPPLPPAFLAGGGVSGEITKPYQVRIGQYNVAMVPTEPLEVTVHESVTGVNLQLISRAPTVDQIAAFLEQAQIPYGDEVSQDEIVSLSLEARATVIPMQMQLAPSEAADNKRARRVQTDAIRGVICPIRSKSRRF